MPGTGPRPVCVAGTRGYTVLPVGLTKNAKQMRAEYTEIVLFRHSLGRQVLAGLSDPGRRLHDKFRNCVLTRRWDAGLHPDTRGTGKNATQFRLWNAARTYAVRGTRFYMQ